MEKMDEKEYKVLVLAAIVAVPALVGAVAAGALFLPALGTAGTEQVTAERLAAGAVTSEKIAGKSVDLNKLGEDVLQEIEEGKEAPIQGSEIADNAVAESKLAGHAVTGEKIARGAVENAHIAANAGIADSKLAGLYLQLAAGLEKGDKAYIGSISFSEAYPLGGEKVDLGNVFQNKIKAVFVEPSKQGYLLEVDSSGFGKREFKAKAMQFDYAAGSAAPAVEVEEDANMSSLQGIKFIAIGK